MQRDQIELELRNLIEEVSAGHERLQAGEDFGMQGISQRIDTTCKAALALPKEEVVTLQPIMTELRNRLQEFSEFMQTAMSKAQEADAGPEDGGGGPGDGGE